MLTPTLASSTIRTSKPRFVAPAGRLVAAYTSGADVTAQHIAVSTYCRRNFGHPLGSYFQDDAGYERLLNGPSMRSLIEDIEANEIGVFIVESLGRISCDFRHLVRFARLCCERGVQVHTPTAGPIQILPFTNPGSDAPEQIAAASKPELATIATATF